GVLARGPLPGNRQFTWFKPAGRRATQYEAYTVAGDGPFRGDLPRRRPARRVRHRARARQAGGARPARDPPGSRRAGDDALQRRGFASSGPTANSVCGSRTGRSSWWRAARGSRRSVDAHRPRREGEPARGPPLRRRARRRRSLRARPDRRDRARAPRVRVRPGAEPRLAGRLDRRDRRAERRDRAARPERPRRRAVVPTGTYFGCIGLGVVAVLVVFASVGIGVADGPRFLIVVSFTLALVCLAVYRWLLDGAAKMLTGGAGSA